MITAIILIWLLLTLPIMREVERELKGFDRVTFAAALWQSIWNVPMYYYLTIKELITNKK